MNADAIRELVDDLRGTEWNMSTPQELADLIADRLEEALRQSQSLPAGAVAWAIELSDGSIGALGWSDMRLYESAQNIGKLADGARYVFAYREQALQADAREKGEIADLESDIDTLVDHNMALQSAIRDAIKIHSSFGTTADMADWLRDELDALATQPAQASEKGNG